MTPSKDTPMIKDCGETIYNLHCKGEFQRINDTLSRIDKSLNGNGKPGVLTRMDRVEHATGQCVERHRQEASRHWDIVKPIIVSVLAAVLSATGVIKFASPQVTKAEVVEILKQVLEER